MQKTVNRLGLIGLSLIVMPLIGCPAHQSEPRSPEYSYQFLAGVKQEWEESKHGPFTKEALKDWMVMAGI